MGRQIIDEPSRTFIEYRFLPALSGSEHSVENISFRTPVVKYKLGCKAKICLNIPFVSAAMQSVSGTELAIALAREGGLSFIFCSQPIESEAKMVEEVKNYKAGFVKSDSNLSISATLGDVRKLTEKTGHSTIAITIDGEHDSKLLGIITDMDYWPTDDDSVQVKDIMTPFEKLKFGVDGINLKDANEILRESKKSCIPIINNEKDRLLKYLVFKKDYMMHRNNPNEILDENKRFAVGAGVNTKDYEERIPVLVEAGADVMVIDTSDGHSNYVIDVIKWSKKNYPNVPIGAGNVVTAQGFYDLVEAGADFVKVGIGGGSICITQEQKGIGRGQATAVKEVCEARDEYAKKTGVYVPVCSDGGLVQDSHILMALAFGADFVMMGRYFARYHESPTEVKEINGRKVKPYWGEGSDRAKNWQRYFTGGKANKLMFEEGVDGFVLYSGYLKDNVEKTMYKMKSTMGNLGCISLEELHNKVVLQRSSSASIQEGKSHDIILKSDGTYESKNW